MICTKIQLLNSLNDVVYEYTIVIYGDVTGDGKVSPSDYVRVKNKIIGSESLIGCFERAGDVTGDGNISPSDYVKIKNHILHSFHIQILTSCLQANLVMDKFGVFESLGLSYKSHLKHHKNQMGNI